jgi:Transglutaminase-like superfamily
MATRITKFLRLSWSQRLRLGCLAAELATVSLALKMLSLSRLTRQLERSPVVLPDPALDEPQLAEARHSAAMISAADALVPWSCTCLSRALTLQRHLMRQRIGGQLCLGVNREVSSAGEPPAPFAHAWVECGGVAVAGESTAGFRVIVVYRW